MKPAEQRLQLERQKLPLEFNTYGPGRCHRRVCTKDSCASSPSEAPAGALALTWAGDAQEPKHPGKRASLGPDRAASGVRSEGRGSPGQLDALAGRAG